MSHSQSIQPSMPVASPSRGRMSINIWPMVILLEAVVMLNLIGSSYHLATAWWANFIFIPAVALLASAWWLWPITTNSWRIVAHACLSLGAVVFTLATVLFFNLIWFGWTLLLIVPSLALLGHSLALARMTDSPELLAWLRTFSWASVASSLLGMIFLLMSLNLLPMQELVGSFQWWSAIVILAGIGAIGNAWWLYRRMQGQLKPTVVVLGGLGTLTCISGLLEAANIL